MSYSNIVYHNYHIAEIDFATPAYDESLSLRDKILRKPLGIYYKKEDIEEEFNQIHLCVFDSQTYDIVAVLVLRPIAADNKLQMRQVAVEDDLQGKGIGRMLVTASERLARSLGCRSIFLHARKIAIPFYERLGYFTYGMPYMEVGISHQNMRKRLK